MILIRESEFDMEKRKLTKEDLDKVRHIEGFPIGKDEDIIALSDPPYYTACPNPFIADFIKEHGTPYDEATDDYHREPFASDVSEGKSDAIYNAHSYHTKVPYKAIMRYILHYTNPGDIVFDGFCGTGMTGIAANMCGHPEAQSMQTLSAEMPCIKWGNRIPILLDLAPIATLIANNYNSNIDIESFKEEAEFIISKAFEECSWMYETQASDTGAVGIINYTVWSDVFICPNCGHEIIFYDVAVDSESGKVSEDFFCDNCGARLKKKDCNIALTSYFDTALNMPIQMVKQKPVLINYQSGTKKHIKRPDIYDLNKLKKIEELQIPYWYPTLRMCEGRESRRNDKIGLTHTHHYFYRRTLYALSKIFDLISKSRHSRLLKILFTSQIINISKMNRFRPQVSFPYNPLSGTLYVASMVCEANPFVAYKAKNKKFKEALACNNGNEYLISTGSITQTDLPSSCVDYIFTDPPFGANLNYSELSFLWESWISVTTDSTYEAIVNTSMGKQLTDYQKLMTQCFAEYFRVLKPNRWMTVEFHNSKNAVWNSIQEALQIAGFIVADVRTLDKQLGSFKQVTNTSAVKQDLVISAYKPSTAFTSIFTQNAGTEETAWAFVRQHLANLPVVVKSSGKIETVTERQAFLLFDRMVAYHIMQGLPVPIDAADFYKGLDDRFLKRDRMYFLPDQVNEYDLARSSMELEKADIALFVTDEKSAIGWLYVQLDEKNGGKRQTYQVLQPKFMQEVRTVKRTEKMPELITMLEENFLEDDSGAWYVPDLAKSGDVAKLREKNLLKEFQEYQATKGKLKVCRSEAIRVGFAKLWKDKEYKAIVALAERLPEETVQEDPNILMYYDISLSRV